MHYVMSDLHGCYEEYLELLRKIRFSDEDVLYVLVHAGLEPFVPGKHLKDYTLAEMIFQSPDYNRVYFENRYLVTGHTPTITQENPEKAKVLEQNHHIAIDCGCVFGGRLAVYCLDTGEAVYADRK